MDEGHHIIFRKISIIGVGLIGGSIGMAVKKRRLAYEIVGLSLHHATLVYALKNRAIDRAFHDIHKAVHNADLVILATPVNTILQLLPTLGPHLKRGCIVTDVGSTKVSIVDTAEKKLPPHCYFVGSHPLAGSEKQGAAFANPDMFVQSSCIVTATEKTNRVAKEKMKAFWSQLGANVKFLTPAEHDKILAYISHLPHLLAYAMMGIIPAEFLEYASTGLKDTTRVAASSPHMWNDICMTNHKNILATLDELVKFLAVYRKSIIAKDEQGLIENFSKSKAKRDGITQ